MLNAAAFQAYVCPLRQVTSAGPYTLNWAAPEDCCGLLGLASGSSKSVTYARLPDLMVATRPNRNNTEHIDVCRHHWLYLHSQALANLRALGPGGSRTVLARVPVASTFGGISLKQHSGHVLDFQPCGGRTLRTL